MEGVNGYVLFGSRWSCFSGDFLGCRAGAGAVWLHLRQPAWRSSPEAKEMGWRGNLEARTKMEGAVVRLQH